MNPPPDPSASRSGKRAEAQRNRILNAAEKCFIERGFNAAGMALIAETAAMSPGLIYRYFDSKDAIILAIIERQLRDRRAEIARLQAEADFVGRVLEVFPLWQRAQGSVMNPALLLEMSAEASRNPRIAAALGNADKVTRQDFRGWLRARARAEGRTLPEHELRRRAYALQIFIEGLVIRAVREPDNIDAELRDSIRLTVQSLLDFAGGD
jgi:AcrR family transcriptional regulator